jgi:predicted 3-demethylubiquinone-9 3-methyltransferase (glyoxalase superfamily)
MPDEKLMTCLWFNMNAEEAVDFYLSVFKNGKKHHTAYYGDAGPAKKGEVLTIDFEIEGQRFLALNGGANFHFTPAISIIVNCEDQKDVDMLWGKLTANGGKEVQCGWLTDKFGLSWQIVPRMIMELYKKNDQRRIDNMMRAMFPMKKLDLAAMKAAYEA